MTRLSISFFLFSICTILLTSCTSLFKSSDVTDPIPPALLVSDTGGTLSGTIPEYVDPFIDGIEGLEKVKNYKEFSLIYPKISDYIDTLILDGSGSLVFNYKIVDSTIPYLYICRLTLSGDERLIRTNIEKYKTVIPPIRKVNTTDSRDVMGLFMDGTMDIMTLYDTLLSPEVQLPQYYIDLIQQRRSSLGAAVADDCSDLMLKHEEALFTQNK